MKSTNESIVVALAADQNYYKGLLVTTCSMARYARKDCFITWVILDGGICLEDIEDLKQCILRDHDRSSFKVMRLDKTVFDGVASYNGSIMTYARLLLPRLLPDCEFVIYCDVDFLWRADIFELWQLRNTKYIVQSTLDERICHEGSSAEDRWGIKYGYSFDRNHYFCAGLCVFNLDRLRLGTYDNLIKIMYDCPDAPMADQTIMNAVFDNSDIGLLPQRWQRLVVEITEEKTREPLVLHFASIPPWRAENAKLISDAMLSWFKEYSRVRGISTLSALGTVHNKFFAVFSRLSFLFATSSKFSRFIFKSCLELIGHEGYMVQCVRLPKLV
jgi:lipopolysaccharide biosynthesis glycosyltransferase